MARFKALEKPYKMGLELGRGGGVLVRPMRPLNPPLANRCGLGSTFLLLEVTQEYYCTNTIQGFLLRMHFHYSCTGDIRHGKQQKHFFLSWPWPLTYDLDLQTSPPYPSTWEPCQNSCHMSVRHKHTSCHNYRALFRPLIACHAGKSLNFQTFFLKFQIKFEFSNFSWNFKQKTWYFKLFPAPHAIDGLMRLWCTTISTQISVPSTITLHVKNIIIHHNLLLPPGMK